MKSSKGRHGGNRGGPDKAEAENIRKQSVDNTDVDSLAEDRNVSRAGGHKVGAD